MSLINDMLRDLDRRQGVTGALPNEVRPLPPDRAGSIAQPLALVLVGVLAVAGWLHFVEMSPRTPAPVAAPASQPSAPSAIRPLPPPAPVAMPVTVEPGPVREVVAVPEGLRLDATLSHVPAAAAPPGKPLTEMAKGSPATPKVTDPVVRPIPPAADKAARTPVAKPVPAEPPQGASGRIEKHARVETPKERAEQYYRKAYSQLSTGRMDEAVSLLRSALAEDAAHVSARLALAGALSQSGRAEESLALLSEGLQLDPSRPALALSAARLLVAKGNFDGAVKVLTHAAPSARTDAEFRAFHAAVLQRLTLHKDAVAEYQAALRLVPQAGVWWMGLGISLEADGRGAEAREAFQRARASGALSAELDRFVEQKLRQLQ